MTNSGRSGFVKGSVLAGLVGVATLNCSAAQQLQNSVCCKDFKPGADFSDPSITFGLKADSKELSNFKNLAQLAGDISSVGTSISSDLMAACTNLATDFGASADELKGAQAKFGADGMGAMCDLAVGKIQASITGTGTLAAAGIAKLDGLVKVDPPRCDVDANFGAKCSGSCTANASCQMTPAEVVANCDPGSVSGTCTAECKGTCEGSVEAAASCEGSCSASCEGSCEASAQAPKIDCQGSCEGSCEGTCEVTATGPTASCDGSCTATATAPSIDCNGSCSGNCNGTCDGTATTGGAAGAKCSGVCAGKCDAKCELKPGAAAINCTGKCELKPASVTGKCAGTCKGKCDAKCTATPGSASVKCDGKCTGKCTGSCKADAKATVKCDGECKGGCSVDYKAPKCTVQVKNPKAECKADAKCDANCSANASARATCKPAQVVIAANFSATVTGDARAQASAQIQSLERNLPAIFTALKGRLPQLETTMKGFTGADGDGKLSGFLDGDASAYAPATGCFIPIGQALTTAATNLTASVNASVKVGTLFGVPKA